MIFFTLCLLAIFACVAVIFGRDTAQRGVFMTLGIAGALVLSFVQACLWVGLIVLAFFLPLVGVPLLLIALLVKYVLPLLKTRAETTKRIAALSGEQEEQRKRHYKDERKAEELRQAVERADDESCIALCKELSRSENWHLGIPILRSAFHAEGEEPKRLCAIHGLPYIYRAQTVQRGPDTEAGWSQYMRHYKPELISDVVALLVGRASDVREGRRVRVAALIGLGKGGFVDAVGSVMALLRDRDEDVRAAAFRAACLLMTPSSPVPTDRWRNDQPPSSGQLAGDIAEALYGTHFGELLSAIEEGGERLRLEAVATICSVARLAPLSAADLDGLLRMMQGLSSDRIVSVKVHDAADAAVEVLRSVQQSHRARGGANST